MSKQRQPYDGATPYYGEKMNGEVALWAHKQMAQDRKLIEALRAENLRLKEALAEANNLLHNLTAIIPGNDTAGLEVARLLRAAASINGVNDAAS